MSIATSQEREKASIQLRPETGFRGWQQLGSNVTRYEGAFQRDMHEALDFYREEDPSRVQVLRERSLPAGFVGMVVAAGMTVRCSH